MIFCGLPPKKWQVAAKPFFFGATLGEAVRPLADWKAALRNHKRNGWLASARQAGKSSKLSSKEREQRRERLQERKNELYRKGKENFTDAECEEYASVATELEKMKGCSGRARGTLNEGVSWQYEDIGKIRMPRSNPGTGLANADSQLREANHEPNDDR